MVDLTRFKALAEEILGSFRIEYVDFTRDEFLPYRRRGIGAVTRFDEREIYIDLNLPPSQELATWAHELLSIYYYLQEGYIRHDDEVETEALRMARDPAYYKVLQELIRRFKKATASM